MISPKANCHGKKTVLLSGGVVNDNFKTVHHFVILLYFVYIKLAYELFFIWIYYIQIYIFHNILWKSKCIKWFNTTFIFTSLKRVFIYWTAYFDIMTMKTFNSPLLKFLVCSFHKKFHNVGFLFQFGIQTLLFQMPEYPKERKFWFLTSYNYIPKAANISSGK